VQGSITYNDNTQSNSPCLKANIPTPAGDTDPGRAAVGQCITEIKGIPFVNPFGVKGGVAAFSPKVQANLRARYEWNVNEFKMFASAGVSYTGEMFNQPANYTPGSTPSEIPVPDTTYLRYKLPAYATADASFGVGKDNWMLEVYGTNLFDSQASTFTTSAQFIKAVVPLRPRVIGVKVTAGF
jgi:iron complex outermembrane receptor protein